MRYTVQGTYFFMVDKMNPCLICQGAFKPFKTIINYELEECTGCGIIKLVNSQADQLQFIENTRPDQSENKNHTAGYDYFSFPEYVEKYQPIFDFFFRQRLNRLAAHGIKSGANILDAGCGYGFFVKHLSDHGFEADGIDIEPNCVEYAKTTL